MNLSALGSEWSQVIATSLPKLTVLSLRSCNLVGQFPEKIFMVPTLQSLDISYNELLQGSLPQFPKNSYVRNLVLRATSFSGSLPTSFGNLHMLSSIDLRDCNFSGTLSSAHFKDLQSLETLNMQNNSFSGTITSSLFRLSELRRIDLSNNQFSSQVDEILDLHSNQLKGEVPHLSSLLEYVDFSKNSLTGSIPNSICSMKARFFDLSNNSLIGTIPSRLVSSGTLKVLNLVGNNLNGSITFPSNSRLKILDLGMNKLQGKLPRTISNCTMLEMLDLGNNKIKDVFPCMFQDSSTLRVLVLRSNNFHGELECFGYNGLDVLDLSHNEITGEIPSSIGKLSNLQLLDLSRNQLTEEIPSSIGKLSNLQLLELSKNQLAGEIPSSISKLSNLQLLDLSRNQLTGEIPSALLDLTFLSHLNLSFNMLTGNIPTGPQFQTFSNDSYIGNVGLCGLPLNVRCGDDNYIESSIPSEKEIDWMYVLAMGYTVG